MKTSRWFAVVPAALALAACGGEEAAQRVRDDSPVAVRVQEVERTSVPVLVTAVGTTEPYARANPGTRLMGQVVEVNFAEGDLVRAGQLMVRIESGDLAARKAQAEAGLREARAVLAQAEKDVTRMRNLFAEEAVTQHQLDEAETGYARSRAGVAAAEDAVREAEAHLRYGRVTAPMNGLVVGKNVQPGDLATPGTPLFTLERQDSIKVVADVHERDVPYLSVGAEVEVIIRNVGTSGEEAAVRRGVIETMVPAADPASRTFRVKAVIANGDGAVRSGMFARVRFPRGERAAVLVPSSAIVRRGQLQGVFTVDDGRARLRWLRLGRPWGERIEAVSGLNGGELVVLDPDAQLRDGQPVTR